MKIEFKKVGEGKFEINMAGRLDECAVVVEALENVVNESKAIHEATVFLRKKLNEHRRR